MLRFGLTLSAIVFVLDQITKWLVLDVVKLNTPECLEFGFGCERIEISPIFDLSMVWNRGISFGLLQAETDIMRWLLVAAMLLISGIFLSWLRTADRRLTAIALGLVIGGALGNVIDRIRFGAVADFLDFSGLYFPWVFNVADAAITIGAILLAIDMLFVAETEPGKGSSWSQLKTWVRGQAARFSGRDG